MPNGPIDSILTKLLAILAEAERKGWQPAR